MEIQEILAFSALIIAIGFLLKKFIWKPKSKKGCGDGDCGCH
ncbi:MAG: FeoB-associated Cys-rich membrane protein [Flavobacterium sp.]|nr:FeoB-associated Cys-rich membrane protein [Flavobacterium sp.]